MTNLQPPGPNGGSLLLTLRKTHALLPVSFPDSRAAGPGVSVKEGRRAAPPLRVADAR